MVAGRAVGNNIGVLNTGWTDDVVVLMRPALPGLAYGAVAGWNERPVPRDEFVAAYARIEP